MRLQGYGQNGATPPNAQGTTGDLEMGNRVVSSGGLYLYTMGTAVASANNLVLPTNGNVYHVTGTTQVNLLSAVGARGGYVVTLIFDGTLTVKHNQAVSGDFKPVLLRDAADFGVTANSTLTLVYDSTNSQWLEVGRAYSSGTGQPSYFSAAGTGLTAGSTQFFSVGILNIGEAVAQVPVANAVTYSALYVALNGNVGGVSDSVVVTLRKNGADTTMTTTINTGSQSGSDTAHSATFAAGDLLDFEVVTSAGAGTPTVSASLS